MSDAIGVALVDHAGLRQLGEMTFRWLFNALVQSYVNFLFHDLLNSLRG